MAEQASAGGRRSREDFLQAAFALMADGRGVEAISIDALCRRLAVSKGSFYWHFKNREALVEALIESWAGHYQQSIHAALEAEAEGEPRRVLEALVGFWLDSDISAIDRAMRHWAYSDERVLRAVQRADGLLFEFLLPVLKKLGHGAKEARRRARLLMAVGIAEPEVTHLPKVGSDRQEVRWVMEHIVAAK